MSDDISKWISNALMTQSDEQIAEYLVSKEATRIFGDTTICSLVRVIRRMYFSTEPGATYSTAPRKVVYNACFGGFTVSPAAMLYMFYRLNYRSEGFTTPVEVWFSHGRDSTAYKAITEEAWNLVVRGQAKAANELFKWDTHPIVELDGVDVRLYYSGIPRDCPQLVAAVEALGDEASGQCAELRIVEVDGAYHITEYDGNERVCEGPKPRRY